MRYVRRAKQKCHNYRRLITALNSYLKYKGSLLNIGTCVGDAVPLRRCDSGF